MRMLFRHVCGRDSKVKLREASHPEFLARGVFGVDMRGVNGGAETGPSDLTRS